MVIWGRLATDPAAASSAATAGPSTRATGFTHSRPAFWFFGLL